MSARKSSHRTIFLIVSSGSPLALIASSLRSTSKKPFCPMTRSLHPPITACGHRVRFAGTWREEFFEAPYSLARRRHGDGTHYHIGSKDRRFRSVDECPPAGKKQIIDDEKALSCARRNVEFEPIAAPCDRHISRDIVGFDRFKA